MTEELKDKLTERFKEITKDELSAGMHFTEVCLKAYLAGGEYGYELGNNDAVEKACEWIAKTLASDFMVERFKQAMEQ